MRVYAQASGVHLVLLVSCRYLRSARRPGAAAPYFNGGIMDPTAYITQHENRFLAQLQELLRIPSVSALTAHRGDVAAAAEWVAADLRAVGLHGVETIADPQGGHPLVYGEWLDAPGRPTVLIYGHYDVQPPDPLDLWQTPPFEPTVRGDDLYARGAADDKGQMLALLKGVEALLQSEGQLPRQRQGADRGRRGGQRDAYRALRARQRRAPARRHGPDRRFAHVRARRPDALHRLARAGLRRDRGPGRRPRPALGPLRRRGPQRPQRAGRDPGGAQRLR